MVLSDISIKRPVFATVMSLLLVVLGVISFTRLSLRELPNIDPPIVSVEVNYPGASAAVVETRVTQILEDAVAGIEGIDTIESRSRNGRADVTIEFKLSREIESATNDVRDAISRIMNRLPDEADPPQVAKVESDADPIMWLNLNHPTMDALALNDYAERYLVDRFSALDGIAQVMINGGQRYAMRIWLDRNALAARGLTVNDIEQAMRRENVELPAGQLESSERDFTLRMTRSYQTAEDFAAMPVAKGSDGYVVRLGDVARVERGSAERRAYFRGNGIPQLGIGIIRTSTANSLEVANSVKAEVDALQDSLPDGMLLFVAFDSTTFIEASVNRVYWTLAEAMVLVLLVIFLFLGSVRAALVPAVTVPVCLVAAFIGLLAFGYTINLLTLLALVLCIGLVVDDAIIVLENCQRRVDAGEPKLLAAYRGTRQVAFAVIATTVVLCSVFLPIAFLEGNNGRLFRELAVALASAIALSAFVALTLTPMMCSKLLKPHTGQEGLVGRIDRTFARISRGYRGLLTHLVGRPLLIGALMLVSLVAIVFVYSGVRKELAPAEDRGAFFVMIQGPEGAGFDYTVAQVQEVERRLMPLVEDGPIERVNTAAPSFGGASAMHTGRAVVLLKDWSRRDISTADLVEQVRHLLGEMPGARAQPMVRAGLVRSRGQPLQIVLGGPTYEDLVEWRDRILPRLEDNQRLFGLDTDYKETRPQMRVAIDRGRAADLGVSVSEIGRTLETMMGSRRVTTFVEDGEEYDVVLQADAEGRTSPSDLHNLYVRSQASGELIPLANLVTLSELAEPASFNRFNRLRAITISAGLAPGYTLAEALVDVQTIIDEELPQGVQLDYKGEARDYVSSGSAVMFTFAMALLIVYLVLAAQFESFIHPLVIMLTVPLAVLGALLGIWLFNSSLNLFSQIGIVMLIGLAAKNGILIVEFANQLRDEGRSVGDAILDAAVLRLRPILMTSLATIFGALPLVLAGGPGSASRGTIGIVIITGVAFSSLLSLFVVPAFYRLLAPYTHAPGEVAEKLEALDREIGARVA